MSEDTLAGSRKLLLTGATGYIGGRLLRLLEDRGEPVRCLVRRPEALGDARGNAEIVQGTCSTRHARTGSARRRHRVLPRALDGLAGSVRGRGSTRRRHLRGRRRRGGRPPHRLPGRAGRRVRSVGPPGQSPGGGRHPRRVGCSGARVPRLDRDRLRQPLLRIPPRAPRATAGDDHATVGARCRAADCRRGRARIPDRRARCRGRRERRIRVATSSGEISPRWRGIDSFEVASAARSSRRPG